MEAITRQFILPIQPQVKPAMPSIYPWEHTNLLILCQELYELASRTGYNGTLEEFKTAFGTYLEGGNSIIDYDIYTGQYSVDPLPDVEQILRTRNRILKQDIVVAPIPYHETDNNAGGRTVSIG